MSSVNQQISTAQELAALRERKRSKRKSGGLLRRLLLSDYFVFFLTIFFFVVASIVYPALLPTPQNIANQLQNIWPLLAVTIGQTFVLILGGIDLSVGAIMGITSVVGAILMAETLDPAFFDRSPLWGTLMRPEGGILAGSEWSVLISVLVMLGLGSFIGFLNGFAITRFNLAPFMVTLVTSTFFAAFALWLTQSRNISGLPEEFVMLGKGNIIALTTLTPTADTPIRDIIRNVLPFITYPFIITISLAIVGQFILSRTVFGRHMFSIGTNRRAATISGVPTKRVITLVYMFSGFCAAVASILYSARLGIGQPSLGGGNLLLDIIGAAVIGGTSLFGGKGSVRGSLFGAAFFVFLLNILNAMRLSPFVIDAVKGLIILFAALLDITRTRWINREQSS